MRPELHPACAAFPPLDEVALQELADSIRQSGQRDAITLMPDGRILDGRCRWDACERAGVEPRTEVFDGDEGAAISFVLDRNARRRHMTKPELILAIAALERLGPPHLHKSQRFITASEVARKAGAGTATMQRAREIIERGASNVIDMVKREEIGIETAAIVLRSKPTAEEQASWTPQSVKRAAREAKDAARGKPLGRKPKPAKPRVARIRYGEGRFPTWEETGFPVNGTQQEKDAHIERYGRTPLWPQVIKHMIEHRSQMRTYISQIGLIADGPHPSAPSVFEGFEEMLAWKPQPDPDKMGYGHRYAADARQALDRLDKVLDKAIERLTALREAYDAWKVGTEPTAVCEESA